MPATTVDRQCGSGLAAVLDAVTAARVDPGIRVAGGAESPSTAPVRAVDGVAYDRAPFAPLGFADPDMPRAAEYAMQLSHQRDSCPTIARRV